jgi:uncharacterized protein (DUF169 family)
MPKLGGVKSGLYLYPLEQADIEPDVIIVEDEVEKLMWIALADLHRRNGSRVESSTAILQATCVDATVIPYLEQRLNLSYGCYGCRDATDIHPSERFLAFPCRRWTASLPIWNIWPKGHCNSQAKKAYRCWEA